MLEYVIRRLFHSVLVLLALTAFVFIAIRLVPGNTVRLQLEETPGVSEEEVQRRMDELGLNDPIYVQLGDFAKDVATGDFGRSFVNERPVLEQVFERLPATVELAFFAMLTAIVAGWVIGLLSAFFPNTWIDQSMRVLASVGLSVPNFWLGLMLLTYSSIYLGWIPPLVYRGPTEDLSSNLQHMIFPAIALASSAMASVARMLRSSMLEVSQSNFVRALRARGAGPVVVARHCTKNSLLPVMSIIGIRIGHVLGGTVILEAIFSIPGMGSLIYGAVSDRDYPLVLGCVVVYGAMFILVNLLVDVAYAVVDPRIRYT